MNNFIVGLNREGSSPFPQQNIWKMQHLCVSEYPNEKETPTESRCGEIIIKHQLNSKRPHVSVLDQAFVSFYCEGFPHSTMTQIRTHSSSGLKVLAQSGRYTGNRFLDVIDQKIDIEQALFFSPVGTYQDRQGHRFEYTEEERQKDIQYALEACTRFSDKVKRGCPFELAREQFPYEFRQVFGISGTFRALFHMLDYRSAKNAELWCQILSKMILDAMLRENYAIELVQWYKDTRFGKAITGI